MADTFFSLNMAHYADIEQKVPPHLIGRGVTSAVYLASWNTLEVAIKVLNTLSDTAAITRELDVIRALQHPNIIQVIAICDDLPSNLGTLGILMEYAHHGDLQKYLEAPTTPKPSLSLILKFSLDICSALRFCHSRGLIHRDVKSMNICITNNLRAKVMDFGLSKFLDQEKSTMTAVVGTYQYTAPEILDEDLGDGTVRPSCDVYSFGVVVWEMVSGKRPWDGLKTNQIISGVLKGKQLEIPVDWAAEMKIFVSKCLSRDQADRPNFEEIHAMLRVMFEAEVSRQNAKQISPPFSFLCSITREVMDDPVSTADGHSYERLAIQQWLEHHNTSPLTNAELSNKDLIPNRTLKAAIEEWRIAPSIPLPEVDPVAAEVAPVAAEVDPVAAGIGKQLCDAVSVGDLEKLRLLTEKWSGNNVLNWANPDDSGWTPLYIASCNGHSECVNVLKAVPNIDFNKADNYSFTPLHAASYNGHIECVKV